MAVEKNTEINVGEWVIVKSSTSNIKKHLIGLVLGFVYLNRANDKQREFSKFCAECKNKDIGVLGTWYELSENLYNSTTLSIMVNRVIPVHEYRPITGYLCTLPNPQIREKKLYYPDVVLKQIEKFIPKICSQITDLNVGNYILVKFCIKKTKKY